MDIYFEILEQHAINKELLEEYFSICKQYYFYKSKKEAVSKLNVAVESHHILPKCFNLGGENDKNNITYLPLELHRIAHKLLKDIFIGKMKQQMTYAYLRLIRRHGSKETIPIEEYTEIRNQVSALIIQNNKNRIITDEYRLNMSLAKKGIFWVTNGAIEIMLNKNDTIPEGYYLGRCSKSNKNKILITNGTENKMIDPNDEIPEGWKLGMSRKIKKQNISSL
jgi:hypothetical protein